ncbi:DnaJ domain-containing protein [Ahrensia sp. R2A130]|uniref:DnaJ domain-containing protein n=1 Tax=Ahrensia sp. R2A130 TaxID=744979 RepID=UPI0001E0BC13|nr:DnaJ domain-containing protein [Ahrensia sp. R2A130]EFL90166.1 heat shock protein DnaJ domain protein [Ahrensia sp. R2A130]
MTFITGLIAFGLIAAVLFVVVPAAQLATIIRRALPVTLFVLGGGALLLGRAGLGMMMVMGGAALWRRWGGVSQMFGGGGSSGPSKSSVRSAALEMELDHDSGEMNGIVLVGRHEGRVLDEMDEADILDLRSEVVDDGQSLALLDAYLDRRFPAWREDGEGDAGAGQTAAPSTGPMGEQEAYEVLGLAAGAGIDEIKAAHRRLMKTAHPDSGGSTFLAAKINEAKDILLRAHG